MSVPESYTNTKEPIVFYCFSNVLGNNNNWCQLCPLTSSISENGNPAQGPRKEVEQLPAQGHRRQFIQ